MRTTLTLFATTAVALLPPTARADDDGFEVIQDLFVGEAAATQEQLELQATLAVSPTRVPGGEVLGVGAVFEFGITDALQVEVEVPFALASSPGGMRGGLANVRAGLAYNLWGSRTTLLTSGVEAGFPAGSEAVGEDEWEAEVFVAVHQRVGAVHLAGTFGVEAAFGEEEPETGVEAAAAVFLRTGPVVPVLEAGLRAGEDLAFVLSPAVVWPVGGGVELGLAAPMQFTQAGTSFGAVAVFTYEVELGDDDDDDDDDD